MPPLLIFSFMPPAAPLSLFTYLSDLIPAHNRGDPFPQILRLSWPQPLNGYHFRLDLVRTYVP